VSVSSQRDSEHALIEKERKELADDPEAEFVELVGLYREQGLSEETATRVATELTARDALAAHLSAELNIEQDDVVSPWHAAFASAVAFFVGALLPMATILLLPHPARLVWTFVSVLLALAVTGYLAAWLGGANRGRAIMRTVIGGALALGATFLVGTSSAPPSADPPRRRARRRVSRMRTPMAYLRGARHPEASTAAAPGGRTSRAGTSSSSPPTARIGGP
jgi:VIT1/CCC1 family predicted Fe2+/Mn2+ transporter